MYSLDFLKPQCVRGKVRIGKNFDGGYVVYGPLLAKTDLLISYGVGFDTLFEEHFNKITGRKVFMFDPNMFPHGIFRWKFFFHHFKRCRFKRSWLYFRFTRYWKKKFASLAEKHIFFINEGVFRTKTGNYDTFENHLKQFAAADDRVLLKIDIEGGEYPLFEEYSFYQSLASVNQLVIEFHNLQVKLETIRMIVEKLRASFILIHLHGNNHSPTFSLDTITGHAGIVEIPDVVEMTFVKRSLVADEDLCAGTELFPVPGLDFPNNPRKEDYKLDFIDGLRN